jgi:hypothetical protein
MYVVAIPLSPFLYWLFRVTAWPIARSSFYVPSMHILTEKAHDQQTPSLLHPLTVDNFFIGAQQYVPIPSRA